MYLNYLLYNYYHYAGHVCSCSVSGEGRARESDRRGDNELLLRTESSNGELRSAYGKIHGGMFAVQRRRGTQGRERGNCDDKTAETRAICRMVPNGIQGATIK